MEENLNNGVHSIYIFHPLQQKQNIPISNTSPKHHYLMYKKNIIHGAALRVRESLDSCWPFPISHTSSFCLLYFLPDFLPSLFMPVMLP